MRVCVLVLLFLDGQRIILPCYSSLDGPVVVYSSSLLPKIYPRLTHEHFPAHLSPVEVSTSTYQTSPSFHLRVPHLREWWLLIWFFLSDASHTSGDNSLHLRLESHEVGLNTDRLKKKWIILHSSRFFREFKQKSEHTFLESSLRRSFCEVIPAKINHFQLNERASYCRLIPCAFDSFYPSWIRPVRLKLCPLRLASHESTDNYHQLDIISSETKPNIFLEYLSIWWRRHYRAPRMQHSCTCCSFLFQVSLISSHVSSV